MKPYILTLNRYNSCNPKPEYSRYLDVWTAEVDLGIFAFRSSSNRLKWNCFEYNNIYIGIMDDFGTLVPIPVS